MIRGYAVLYGRVYEIADPDESISLMVDKASAAAQVNKGMMRKEIAFAPFSSTSR